MRVIDLSQPICTNTGEPVPVSIELLSHEDGADILGKSHGVTAKDFPNGHGLSLETVTLTTHTGTHIDAPLHYSPLCNGKPARSIDTLPLDWFIGPGVVLTFSAAPELGAVTADEMREAIDAQDRTITAETIILCNVGAATLWNTPEYFTDFRGISAEAIELLLDLGVRVIGTDAFGMDQPFHKMLDAYCSNRSETELWPAHVLGRSREYCQIERLCALDEIPAGRQFTVACLPIRIAGCGAAWTRAIAYFGDLEEGKSDD